MLVESINKTENNVVKWIKLLILVVLCHIKNELIVIQLALFIGFIYFFLFIIMNFCFNLEIYHKWNLGLWYLIITLIFKLEILSLKNKI